MAIIIHAAGTGQKPMGDQTIIDQPAGHEPEPDARPGVLRQLLPLLSLALVAGLLYREISGVDLRQLQASVQAVPTLDFVGIALTGLVAVSAMFCYDWILCRWLAVPVPLRELFRLSFVANSINNAMSMGGLTGSGIRYLVLSRYGLRAGQLAAYSALIMLAVPVGLAVPALVIGLARPDLVGVLPVADWIEFAALGVMALYGLGFAGGIGLKLVRARFLPDVPDLGAGFRAGLLAASLADWLLAGLVLWFCLVVTTVTVPFAYFCTAFVVAGILGCVSFVPGALGVFDGLILLALGHVGAPAEQVLTALLLYRLAYLLIPLLVGIRAGGGLVLMAPDSAAGRLIDRAVEHPLVRVLGLPVRIVGSVSVRALAYLTFFGGFMLLLSTSFPVVGDRVAALSPFVPFAAIESAHLLSALAGILLIAVSRGIAARIRSSYVIAESLLLAGAALSILKSGQFEFALLLLVIAGLLASSRQDFVRKSYSMLSWRSIRWLLLMLASLGLYLLVGGIIHDQPNIVHMLSRFGEAEHAPRFWRGAFLASLAALIYQAWSWYRMPRPRLPLPSRSDLEKVREYFERYGSTEYSHLVFTGDKHLFYAAEGRSLIQFGTIRNRWIAMGDPAGDPGTIDAALTEFREQAFRVGCDPVFYHVDQGLVHHYHDNGFALLKLGERALVRLADFTLTGRKAEDFRTALNRARREGLTFEVLAHPLPEPVWTELRAVSDSWLRGKATPEKRFSIGAFSRAYLEWSPIAVARKDGRIVAFASLMPGYGHRQACSLDLMRHLDDAPRGTMDYLFVELIQYARATGYEYFSLGEAPLSGVGMTKWSYRREQLVRFIYEHGNELYNYRGLRSFKEKFHPVWRSSYLAYPHERNVELILVDIAALVAGGYLRTVFK